MLYYRLGIGFFEVLSELLICPAPWCLLFMSKVGRHIGYPLEAKVALTSLEGFCGFANLLLPFGIACFLSNGGLLVCFAKVVSNFVLRTPSFFPSSDDNIKTHSYKKKGAGLPLSRPPC